MNTITTSRDELKKIIREAIEDVLSDRGDLIEDAVIEAIEDIGLGRAMEEAKRGDYADTDRFMSKLNARIKSNK